MFGDSDEKLNIPVLSVPSGIGKTSAIKEFSKNKDVKGFVFLLDI